MKPLLPLALIACLPAMATAQITPVFTDQTAAAGINSTFDPRSNYTNWDYTGGGACGDIDGDGWQDMFLLSGYDSGVADKLYLNNQDGTFTNQSAAWGVTAIHNGKGVCVGDYDNDGDLDIYVTSAGGNPAAAGQHKLFENTGTALTDVAVAAGVDTTYAVTQDGLGCAFGDYDLNGTLDLFVSGWVSGNLGSKLFKNNGDKTFTDATAASQLFTFTLVSLRGMAPRFADMDGDRYPELLLANDFGTSRYFKNDGDGTFTDWTTPSGTGLDENGMGQTVGDMDQDGLLDWYVASIFRPSTGWTGNKLYMNQGGHSFIETGQASGVADGGYGWGTVAADFNHDGRPDLAETNGDSGSSGTFAGEQAYLWVAAPTGGYTEMAVSSGFIHNGKGRGMFNLDYDNDGDQDVMLISLREPAILFRNDTPADPTTSWLRVFLDTGADPGLAPDGYGSRVVVTAGGTDYYGYITGGDNFLSQSELAAHFGLGSATQVDRLRVEWTDGSVTTLVGLAVNQTLTVKAPAPTVATLTADPTSVSLAAGGTQTLTVDAGAPHANDAYLFVGSAGGNSPGFGFGGQQVPLNLDFYTLLTLNGPGALLTGNFGTLDGSGTAQAAFTLPAASDPTLAGLPVFHACAVLDPLSLLNVLEVSNSTHCDLVP
jgi:hypothetical protein